MSQDERSIVERHEKSWTMTGFSGHGFSLGALAGIKVAQGIAGELAPDSVARLFRGDNVSATVRAVS